MKIQIHFTEDPICVPSADPHSREIGAIAEFWGVVREAEGTQKLAGLFYEAHPTMAQKHMERILHELERLHPCDSFDFIHRLGWVPVGEASLWIRVQSRHRAEAFALLSESIRRMKVDVPIWKNIRACE